MPHCIPFGRPILLVILILLFSGCATPPRSKPAPEVEIKPVLENAQPERAQQQDSQQGDAPIPAPTAPPATAITGESPAEIPPTVDNITPRKTAPRISGVQPLTLPPAVEIDELEEPPGSAAAGPSASARSENLAAEPEYMDEITRLETLAANGKSLDAALGYIKLAASLLRPQSDVFALRAAELLMTGNYVPQAQQMLADLDKQTLPADLEIRRTLLRARIALARNNPLEALTYLGPASFVNSEGQPELRRQIHRLRANAQTQLGNPLDSARELIALDLMLEDPQALFDNQQAILRQLDSLPLETLQNLHTGVANNLFNGWLELAAINRGDKDMQQSRELLRLWRNRNPQHPASRDTVNAILAKRPPEAPLPEHVALILPLDNRFAKAAGAVRDGFFAAYYAHLAELGKHPSPGAYVPKISVYSEGTNPARINSVIHHAVNDGARFIVGPLNKEAVNYLAQSKALPVPTLTLNFSELSTTGKQDPLLEPPGGLYQMSLSPEEEARQTAERAWLDGHRRAAIIRPDSNWGERVSHAFRLRWRELGGVIAESRNFDTQKSDYSLPIRQLLNVDESQQRNNELRRILGQKLEYTPRRRQDIDFIFMAASSRQARLIKPQLRFHHAIDLPVYATSHSFSGSIDAEMDRDMDGVIFSDIPWTLAPDRPSKVLKTRIAQQWPGEAKLYSRLYALGVDAYHLIGKLADLERDPGAFYRGQTGDLYLDKEKRLQRRLLWAEFKKGVPKVLDQM